MYTSKVCDLDIQCAVLAVGGKDACKHWVYWKLPRTQHKAPGSAEQDPSEANHTA